MLGIKSSYFLKIRQCLQLLKESCALFLFLLALVNFPYIKETRSIVSEIWNNFVNSDFYKSNFLIYPFFIFLFFAIVLAEIDLVKSFIWKYWLKLSAVFITYYFVFYIDLSFPWESKTKIFLFLFLFGLWMFILINSKAIFFSNKKNLEQLTLDDPLENPQDDQLNRAVFAKNIFKVVESLPDNNIRVALTGEWGIGKTTCLNFIAYTAREKDFPIVRFNPWKFNNIEEAWKGFISAVDLGISEWKGKAPGPFRNLNLVNKLLNLARWKTSSYEIGKVFDELFLSRLLPSFEITKEKTSELLLKALKGKKLIILIDDLDRSSAEIVLQVLLNIKEILDVRGCVFICGIDLVSTVKIIKKEKIHFPETYLEKIFQYSFSLPKANVSETRFLLDSALTKIKPVVKNSLIKKIETFLPANPRKLKKYLRSVSSLDGAFLQRFGDEDFLWEVLYLVELAKIQFPERIKLITQDPSFFKWLTSWFLWKEQAKKEPKNSNILELQKWKEKINGQEFTDDGSRQEFENLLDKLLESCLGLTEEKVKSYFDILSYEEPLTWKEYREWRKSTKELNLRKILDVKIPFLTRREYLLTLLREREQFLSQEADDWNHDLRINYMAKAVALTKECLWYIKHDDLNKSVPALLDTTLVIEWLGLLSKWAHFKNGGGFYSEIRELEKQLSIELSKRTSHAASEILSQSRFLEHREDFKATADAIKDIYKKHLAEDLLKRFEHEDGIKVLWGKEHFWPEKDLLLKPNIFFYSDMNKLKLKALCQKAKTERVIQGNFYEYVRMLFYAATDDNSSFEKKPALEILKNDELRELIWLAVTHNRIHRRSVGDLLSDRKKLSAELNNKDILLIPDWVKIEEPDIVEMFKII